MAHMVTCVYCKGRFDRDKIEYAKISDRRYAHAYCALRESAKNPNSKTPEILNPADNVECIYCKKPMHRIKDDCVLVSNGKYAHKNCAELESKRELTDQEKLDQYIMKLFKIEYVNPRIKKQISDYIVQYNFSYSGIMKALIYFFEIKGNPIEKANNGIGIVPHIYKDAYNYYYSLWLARQKNEQKDIELYIPKIKEVVIQRPQRKVKKRNLFDFLDEEETDGQ